MVTLSELGNMSRRGGEGYGPNGVFGSWISGKSLQGEVPHTGQAGFLLPGAVNLAPGPATFPAMNA